MEEWIVEVNKGYHTKLTFTFSSLDEACKFIGTVNSHSTENLTFNVYEAISDSDEDNSDEVE